MRTPAEIRKMTAPSEHDEQVKLVALLLGPLVFNGKTFVRSGSTHTHKWPELELLYAVPLGGFRKKGTAGKLKAEGVQSAVPDLVLPVARSVYHGLYVELKAIGNYSTPAQRQFADRLREQGYAVFEIHGADLAFETILSYLELGPMQKLEIVGGAPAALTADPPARDRPRKKGKGA